MGHIPVLLEEAMHALNPREGMTYIDATFGGGGYTRRILELADCNVIAFDKDHQAIERGLILKQQYPSRLTLVQSSFSTLKDHVKKPVDGIVFDFGVSSFQIDEGARGFSFQNNGPLDMRMDITQQQTAADVVNTFSENNLADIIYTYGEERAARKIAKAIVVARSKEKIVTTFDLKKIIHKTIGVGARLNSATKTFQALRIFINNELEEIALALNQAVTLLKDLGRLVTVSFHALEDRIIKTACNTFKGENNITITSCAKSVIKPTRDEIKRNARARSANLRSFEIRHGEIHV